MTHSDVIQSISDATCNMSGVRALFLSGSYGNGMADEYSDIDFVMVSEDGASDAVAEIWREAVETTGEIVLWWDRNTRRSLINAIMDDWTRIDVIIVKPGQTEGMYQSDLNVLFDHDAIYENLSETADIKGPNPKRLEYQFNEFIKILGLLYLVVGRGEYINGVVGLFHLRNLLVDLLIEETAAPNRGGALHLNRLITDEQKELLLSMPSPVPERNALIDAHLAFADAYLPRARAMAERLGMDWPERFEAATWRKLNEALSIHQT